MEQEILRLLPLRKGHFGLESGHHGDLWIDLELLCLDPRPVRRLAGELAARVSRHNPQIVCGPLVEGAFVALMVALELELPFCYSEPRERTETSSDATPPRGGLYPIEYRIPPALRPNLAGKRVAVINDVINAGSAVRGTMDDLARCGAQPVVIATLAVLGSWAAEYASARNLHLETLARLTNTVWAPSDCPLCKANMPLTE